MLAPNQIQNCCQAVESRSPSGIGSIPCWSTASALSSSPRSLGAVADVETSALDRGELLPEASHGVPIQVERPADARHAELGQLGDGRPLRHPREVDRAGELRYEAAQRVRLPEADRVDAVGAGLEIGGRGI